MKIAVVAANGKSGSLIVKEAVERGHEVTAFGRSENKTVAKNFVKKDIFDLTADDLKNFDVVVDAFGAWTPETLPNHTKTLMHLCDVLSGSKVKLFVVGGAGSLYTDKSHKTQLFQTPDFPESYKPIAINQSNSLDELRKRNDVDWTYVSPAGDFQADGEKTGEYILAGEELTLNSKNESIISYADYAIAMVDQIEKGGHVRQRISVVRK